MRYNNMNVIQCRFSMIVIIFMCIVFQISATCPLDIDVSGSSCKCPIGSHVFIDKDQHIIYGRFCYKCWKGSTSYTVDANTCENCDPGKYYSGEGWPSCDNCGVGSYSGAGHSTMYGRVGSTSCTNCAPGKYSGEGWELCANCGVGPYSGYAAVSCNNSHLDSNNVITSISTSNTSNPTSIITPINSSMDKESNPNFIRTDFESPIEKEINSSDVNKYLLSNLPGFYVCAICTLIVSILNCMTNVILYLRVKRLKNTGIASDANACVGNVSDKPVSLYERSDML